MKIALLASTFLPRIGGAEVVVHNLAIQLRAAGHDARVITWWGLWRKVRGRVPYPVIPLLPGSFSGRNRNRWFRGCGTGGWMAFQIRALQRWMRFDLWNVHMPYPAGMLAVPALARAGVPVVSTCHGDDIFHRPEIEWIMMGYPQIREGILQSLKSSDRVTAISGSVRDEYVRQGIAPDRIRDVPNGTHIADIKAQAVDREQVRREMGWPSDVPVLLSVGRHHKQKGYALIPEILKELASTGRTFIWCVVGSGSNEVQTFCEQAGFRGVVRGVPPIAANAAAKTFGPFPHPELIRLYKAADLFVFPTYFETFGLVLVEAMAAGLPVVTTRVPGCIDVVTDGENGLLASAGNAAEIAAAIRRVLSEPDLRQKLVRNGLRSADRYEWNRVAEQYIRVYEESVQGR